MNRDPAALDDLVAADCVMEAIQPAPDGARYEGRDACLAFWVALVEDLDTRFDPEEVVVMGDHATIRWHYRFGATPADTVAGVTLVRVRDGQIVEALGFSKTGGVPLAPTEATTVQPILCTRDTARLSAFYTDLFDATEELRVPGTKGPFLVTLRFGGATLGLVDYKKGADVAPGRVTVAVFVKDVDALLPRVEPAGGTVLGPANDMPWGHRIAHLTDPDGNRVNLTQRL